MSARRAAALLLATVALSGCGEKAEPDVSKTTVVTGTLDLARPAAPTNPDAGTVAGHRAPDATATTRRSTLTFTGRVQPATSRLTAAPQGGSPTAVRVGADGRFSVRARRLKRGANRIVLRGTSPGLRAWTVDVSITRR
jgi:uncharacterized lipoprotein NlpE involved in copper resistance